LAITGGNRDRKHHVLTYEDKDGDWMMVGDIPWEYESYILILHWYNFLGYSYSLIFEIDVFV